MCREFVADGVSHWDKDFLAFLGVDLEFEVRCAGYLVAWNAKLELLKVLVRRFLNFLGLWLSLGLEQVCVVGSGLLSEGHAAGFKHFFVARAPSSLP